MSLMFIFNMRASEMFSSTCCLISILACSFAFCLIKYHWNRRHLYYYASKIDGPPSLPLIGSVLYLLGGTQDIVENGMRLIRKYKPLFKLWVTNQLTFVVSNPDDIEVILNTCLEKERYYKYIIPVFGNGLITMPLQQWRKHRKVIGLTFNQQILNSFVDIFANYSNNLVEKLKSNLGRGCVDMFPIMSQCTLDTVCATILGMEVNAMKRGSEHILWTSRASELGALRILNVYLYPDFIWKFSSMSKEMDSISEKIHHFVETILEAKRRAKSQKEDSSETILDRKIPKKKVFLDYLIDLIDEDGEWSNEELIDEIRTIIVAASDGIALSVCYVLMMLGLHQAIQNLVHEELDPIHRNSSRDMTTEELAKMTYLERVIKETLRLFPPGPIIGRYLDKNVTLKNHTLPAGSGAVIPIFFLHRDPDVWSDPLTFDPNRFLPEEVAKRHGYSYLPFSGGPRKCLGFRYAMMAIKTILSTILRHYRVVSTEYESVSEIKLKFDVVTRCVRGQKVELEEKFYS